MWGFIEVPELAAQQQQQQKQQQQQQDAWVDLMVSPERFPEMFPGAGWGRGLGV